MTIRSDDDSPHVSLPDPAHFPADPRPLDYSTQRLPRRRPQWTGVLSVIAGTSGVFTWLKSDQYHDYGYADEPTWVCLFAIVAIGCSVAATIRLWEERCDPEASPLLRGACILCIAVALIAVPFGIFHMLTSYGMPLH